MSRSVLRPGIGFIWAAIVAVVVTVAAPPAAASEVLGRASYRDAPGEIDMEGAYRTFARLCFAGQMDEAERRGLEVLDQRGYRGTRFECWVHDKLADGFERVRNTRKAIEYWQKSMLSSDSSKGSWTRARDKLRQYGGTIPSEALRPVPQAAPPAAAPKASAARPASLNAGRVSASAEPAPQGRFSGLLSSFVPSARAAATKPLAAPARTSGTQPSASSPPAYVAAPAATPPRTTEGARSSALAADPTYAQASAELANGGYQELRSALKRLEGMLIDRNFQGTSAEAEIQSRIADAHIALAAHHYRWAEAAASSGNQSRPR